VIVLAIETSCDETSAAVVKNGTEVLSSIISSQNDFHAKYGGIVPEIASRKHIEAISPVIQEAMDRAGLAFKDIDAVAVTFGPGLPGSLIVGLSAAKAISFALKKPLIGVNHLEGHIYANFLIHPSPCQGRGAGGEGLFPFICLIVSGGHTQIVKVTGHMEFETLGRTRDDAAGEAYDKVARFLGLGYPGGPIIDKLSKEGNENAVDFKKPMTEEEYKFDFSFSGIKTAVVYYVKKNPPLPLGEGIGVRDIAASFQKSVVDTLVEKTIKAALEHNIKTVAIGGGVAANSKLRADIKAACDSKDIKCIVPPFELCTDNAAMIGCAGYFRYKKGMLADYSLGIESTARI
jgi:N6-L-threonylcarbamoyladenine synthase